MENIQNPRDNAPDRELFLTSQGEEKYGISYVASPYWHPSEPVLQARVTAARIATGEMVRQGVPAFSPVSYTHTILEETGARPPQGWYGFDLHFLQHAREMIILKLPGWEESRGIMIEKAFAHGRGIPVSHSEMEDIAPMLDEATIAALHPDQEE